MKIIYLLLTLNTAISSTLGADSLEELKGLCSKADFDACEKLTAYYVKTSSWDNALMLAEVLCKKERVLGCTFAGTALLAKGKSKEGLSYLTRACDAFEPYACRSLARLMKQNKNELMSYMYSKRSCHYGLDEACKSVKEPKLTYSKDGQNFFKELTKDCEDSQSSTCLAQLKKTETCSRPLTKEDCLLLPGDLSVHFRAKLMQAEAKLSLMTVVASEKALKENSKSKIYSYDLAEVLREYKPLAGYRYVFGFMSACSKKFGNHKKNDNSLGLFRDSYKEMSSRTIANIESYFAKAKASDCYDPAHGFEAFAVASLDLLNPQRLDVWKINRDSDIIHVQDGLPLP